MPIFMILEDACRCDRYKSDDRSYRGFVYWSVKKERYAFLDQRRWYATKWYQKSVIRRAIKDKVRGDNQAALFW